MRHIAGVVSPLLLLLWLLPTLGTPMDFGGVSAAVSSPLPLWQLLSCLQRSGDTWLSLLLLLWLLPAFPTRLDLDVGNGAFSPPSLLQLLPSLNMSRFVALSMLGLAAHKR